MNIKLSFSKSDLSAEEFISLSKAVGWGMNKEYVLSDVSNALDSSSFIVSIRDDSGMLIACGRALSDGMFFTTIPDLFVLPEFQKKGFGTLIMQKIIEKYSHTKIFFGSQPGNERFFEKLGFEKDLQSYAMKKH